MDVAGIVVGFDHCRGMVVRELVVRRQVAQDHIVDVDQHYHIGVGVLVQAFVQVASS